MAEEPPPPQSLSQRAGPGCEPALLGRGSASLRAWHPGSVEPCWEAGLGRILSRGAEEDLTARLRQSLRSGLGGPPLAEALRVLAWSLSPALSAFSPHGGLCDPGPQSPVGRWQCSQGKNGCMLPRRRS